MRPDPTLASPINCIPSSPQLSAIMKTHRPTVFLRQGGLLVYLLSSARTVAFSLLLLTSVLVLPAFGQEEQAETQDAEKVSFYQEIRPIFQARCHGCHQPAKQEGSYVMTDFAKLLAGGDTGEAAIVAGTPHESYLLDVITPVDGVAEMPADGEPLADHERELIERWIAEGAIDDTPENAVTRFDEDHPPVYESAPVITALDYSPDGKWLAVSGYHEVLVYDTTEYALQFRLIGRSERIESLSFSPDSQYLAVAGGSPGRLGELQVWLPTKRQLVHSINVGYDTLYGVRWSGDGKLIAFGCPDATLRAVDSQTGEQVLFNGAHADWVLDTVFSKESTHLISVSRDRSMKLTEVATQRFVDNITSITPGALTGGLNAVDRHPEFDQLLSGGADGTPKLYRMLREQARKIGDDFNLIRAYPAMRGRIFDITFNSDGSAIAAGSSIDGHGQVRIYKTEDATILQDIDIPESGIFALDFSSDNQTLVVGGFDGKVRVLSVADGKLLKTFSALDIASAASESAEN